MPPSTLIIHRTPVHRPHPFASHRLQRILPTGRGIHRMEVPKVLARRRELSRQERYTWQPEDLTVEPAVRQWPWTLASVALIMLIVAACARVAMH